MSPARIIKKYPNRRLYDTAESRYITLTDIKNLVLRDTNLMVVDKKTGDDITRSVLLQVITEQEQNGNAILSADFLAQIIRCYGILASGKLAGHLTQSLRRFIAQTQNSSDGGAPATYLPETKNSLTSGP